MNYYTADCHVDHNNVIKYQDRPFKNVDDMYNKIVSNWNNTITNKDTVYVLGDICFSKKMFVKLMRELNGNKNILIGNHDAKGLHNLKIPKVTFCPLIHKIKDGDSDIILCHYPIHEWQGYYHDWIHLHGHTHGSISPSFKKNAYDVGVDVCNYTPISLEEIINKNKQ